MSFDDDDTDYLDWDLSYDVAYDRITCRTAS
jgi:hypothetical protein